MALSQRQNVVINLNRESPTASDEYLCGWDEAVFLARGLVGGYQSTFGFPAYSAPASFPEMPGLKVSAVAISNVGDYNGDGYQTAKLAIQYGLCKDGDDNGDPKDIAEISFSVGADSIPIPDEAKTKSFKWASGDKEGEKLKDEDVRPVKWVASLEINIKFKFKPNAPLDSFKFIVGTVNQSDVTILGKTFQNGTLLCVGVTGDVSITSDGVKGYSRDIKLAVKDDGWNALYDAEAGEYNEVEPAIYEGTEFGPLWAD